MRLREKIPANECSLIQFAYGRTGSMLKAARVVGFVIAWRAVRDDLGHEPTVDEYWQWWGVSRRSAYDQLTLFREVFNRADPLVWPGEVLDMIEASQQGVESARFDWTAGPVVA